MGADVSYLCYVWCGAQKLKKEQGGSSTNCTAGHWLRLKPIW